MRQGHFSGILAGIEIGIAAVWLAIQAASIEAWFAELVRRIMFIGFFAFALSEGPSFAKAVVDSLYQIGGGSTSLAGECLQCRSDRCCGHVGENFLRVFQDNALALSASLAMIVSVIAFSRSPQSSLPCSSRCMLACLPA